MWSAVIPAHNEGERISRVLNNLSLLPLNKMIVIANGCKDQTVEEVAKFRDNRLELHVFANKLGVDVPRAVGAKIALDYNSLGVLFIDGDMIGQFNNQLLQLMTKIEEGWDMSLVNCYPFIPYRHPFSATASLYRGKLNRKLGLFERLGIASPSHGPHALSKRLLQTIPLQELAIPPVALALTRQANLEIGVAAGITHLELQSRLSNEQHDKLIAETIIGDCLEALSIIEGKARSRFYRDEEIIGYHLDRRWDLLQAFLAL